MDVRDLGRFQWRRPLESIGIKDLPFENGESFKDGMDAIVHFGITKGRRVFPGLPAPKNNYCSVFRRCCVADTKKRLISAPVCQEIPHVLTGLYRDPFSFCLMSQ